MKTSSGPAHGTGAGFSKDIGLQTGPIRQTKIGSAQKTHGEGTKPAEIARLVELFIRSITKILPQKKSTSEMGNNFRERSDTNLIRQNLNSIVNMLLTPGMKRSAMASFEAQVTSSQHRTNHAYPLPNAHDILQAYLTYLPHLKQPAGERPFAVIRKLRNKKYLALDVGKEMPDGKHYSRVFFGGTLEPVWMEVNPKTGNIVNDTIHTRWK